MNLELLFSPAEFEALSRRDLGRSVCVVFDVLRATSSMITALANGARAIHPVEDIPEALALRRLDSQVLLAGERNGVRILAKQTGSVDFDLGNSPREFTAEKVRGKTIVMTTTNGTRALRACAKAQTVLIGTFLNLEAIGRWIIQHSPQDLILVCSGTFEQAALEDVLAAGALCELVWPRYKAGQISDAAEIANQVYGLWKDNLPGAMSHARNGRRLLANPDLSADVAFCLQRDTHDFVVVLHPDGGVRRQNRVGGPFLDGSILARPPSN